MDFTYNRNGSEKKVHEPAPGFWQLYAKHRKENAKNGVVGSLILARLEKSFPTP